jgi:hypothetical protein
MFGRSKSRQEDWKRQQSKLEDKFIFEWCDSLFSELQRRKTDRNFTNDLVESSVKFFDENLSNQEKADCFLYLLGKIIRR